MAVLLAVAGILQAASCRSDASPPANDPGPGERGAPGSYLILEEAYCATGHVQALTIPRWNPATGEYLGPESDSTVCCVVVFTAPADARVYAPLSGTATTMGTSFWRDTTTGSVVLTGAPFAMLHIDSAPTGQPGGSVSVVFAAKSRVTGPCAGNEGAVTGQCPDGRQVLNAETVGTLSGQPLPGFGKGTIMLKHSGPGGDLLAPEALRAIYHLSE